MLGKLLKYEFKNTSKVMFLLYGLVGMTTLLGMITMYLSYGSSFPSKFGNLLSKTIFSLYGFSAFAVFTLSIVYLCVHFYKTMYSDQGYLTHTLPVSLLATLHTKLGVSIVWACGSVLLIFVSALLLLIAGTHGEAVTALDAAAFAELDEVFAMLGFKFVPFLFVLFFILATMSLSLMMLVFASLSIGQLFTQHRIAVSAASGIAVYFIKQTITFTFVANRFLSIGSCTQAQFFAQMPSFFRSTICLMICCSVACIGIYYVVCFLIVRHHINLD